MKQKLADMICLDIYLTGLSEEVYQEIQPYLGTSTDHVMHLELYAGVS
ncbi:hypothetical protein SAMN05216480_10454 [Pustulibacterium marinum]|uniref:Uncharacterized protein n=1 Tax=Pustulibacterium marinum TaxID=1224947 RepID=A0A1I7GBB8_9FLAO|nr:hypothetical protein [Pustulibacterium marinum]SFU45651.1 hypothetical protein SAMN05216480_10454 [Pustulibacterium marinum]